MRLLAFPETGCYTRGQLQRPVMPPADFPETGIARPTSGEQATAVGDSAGVVQTVATQADGAEQAVLTVLGVHTPLGCWARLSSRTA